MRLPIKVALNYPERLKATFERLEFSKLNSLTFAKPDTRLFRNLELAFEAMRRAGNVPCILNAANEIVVAAFLKGKVGFLEMSDIMEQVIEKIPYIAQPSYDDYVLCNQETRLLTSQLIKTSK